MTMASLESFAVGDQTDAELAAEHDALEARFAAAAAELEKRAANRQKRNAGTKPARKPPVVDLTAGSSDDDKASMPKAKKAKRFDNDAAKAELAAMETAHASELKTVAARHAFEIAALEARIAGECKAAVAAATTDAKTCTDCERSFKAGRFFTCARCAATLCKKHKNNMTTCVECEASYCDDCLSDMPTCNRCSMAQQLTCCDLERMPCGEWEDEHCTYYHGKSCRCQTGGRGFWGHTY